MTPLPDEHVDVEIELLTKRVIAQELVEKYTMLDAQPHPNGITILCDSEFYQQASRLGQLIYELCKE